MKKIFCLLLLGALINSCSHQSVSDSSYRFSPKKIKAEYVLDSEVTMSISTIKGRPTIQVDLPRSRGCQVWLDQDYPGYVYPEQITNNLEKMDPVVFVLKYDSRCMNQKELVETTQHPAVAMTSQIDLYAQIMESKLAQFKKDFESGNIKISVCRFWDCSELVSYVDSPKPVIFFRSEYLPPKFIDLNLGELKPIRPDVLLAEAIHGPPIPVCDGEVKQFPTLAFTMFLPSLPKNMAASQATSAADTRYIFRFHKGNLITKKQGDELAKQGQVFCSVRVVEQKNSKVSTSDSFDFAPLQGVAYASNFGATYYADVDKDMFSTHYFSRTFELYGNLTQQNLSVTGGFCSTPNGDQPNGRQVLVGDIVDNIPGVSLQTNAPAFYAH